MATQEFDLVLSKDLTFHSIRSILIAKLKTKIVKKLKYVNLS